MSPPDEITKILIDWCDGHESALERLVPLVESELHGLASFFMRGENRNHTLQPTALIHEAYIKLIDQNSVKWQNRAHFYAIAARVMRRILTDHAKHNQRQKRGGGAIRVTLSEGTDTLLVEADEFLRLHEALIKLAEMDLRKSEVVELRYFGGLTTEEIAGYLGVSQVTVLRDWSIAKAWLRREIEDGR